MELEYDFEVWEPKSFNRLCINVKANMHIKGDLELLTIFIESLDTSGSEVLAEIVRIENGEQVEGSWGGNIATATYNKDKTYLEFDFDSPRTCELPTYMFKKLVEAWMMEKAKFDAENEK